LVWKSSTSTSAFEFVEKEKAAALQKSTTKKMAAVE